MTAWIFDGEEISSNKYFQIYRFLEFWKYPFKRRFIHIHGYRAENPTRQIINSSILQTIKTSDQQTSGSWNISICNQKGGVGKSALTTLLASYLHYICKCKVLVVDCDYPQWSIYTQRTRELEILDSNDYYKLLMTRQFKGTDRKFWFSVSNSSQQSIFPNSINPFPG